LCTFGGTKFKLASYILVAVNLIIVKTSVAEFHVNERNTFTPIQEG
jgi:hypothetical protein